MEVNDASQIGGEAQTPWKMNFFFIFESSFLLECWGCHLFYLFLEEEIE